MNRGAMGAVRRIVAVSRKPEIHSIAQEVAHEVFVADDPNEAVEIAATVEPDMTVFDETCSPHHIREYTNRIAPDSARSSAPIVVVFSSQAGGTFEESEYTQAGVSHLLMGEDGGRRLREIVAETRQCAKRAEACVKNVDYFFDETAAAVSMVGRSPAVVTALKMIGIVARSKCHPVLIVGETGTGKEIAARAIHALRHPDEPFVAVNCAALTANLLESELFGHVRGAFTGADRDKMGLLELAGAGTIFLDEISEVPLELQAKLLRVLQERTFRKVGGIRDLTCRATTIASSNRDLKKEVREKRFRQDLFYRLNICPILLAPLRSPKRRQDIPLLASWFLKTSSICGDRPNKVTSLTRLAEEALSRHDWPGNVREMRNVIERAILLETTDKIGLSNIVIDPMDSDEPNRHTTGGAAGDFSLQKAERELIARALHKTGWQKTQAAALLGITRATLYAKVKQYDIRQEGHGQTASISSAEIPSANSYAGEVSTAASG